MLLGNVFRCHKHAWPSVQIKLLTTAVLEGEGSNGFTKLLSCPLTLNAHLPVHHESHHAHSSDWIGGTVGEDRNLGLKQLVKLKRVN